MESGLDKDGIIKIKPEYNFGDLVFLRANPEFTGIVIAYELRPGFIVKYGVKWSTDYDCHYGFELETLLIDPT